MMTAMGNSQRLLFGTSLIVIALLAAACSSSGGAATTTPDSTETAIATADDPTASPTSDLPDWVRDRIDSGDLDGDGSEDSLDRYVVDTGSGGVSHRTACEDSARLDTVWDQGANLTIVASNSGECDGWTLVTDGDVTSWVLNKYLDDEKPLTVATVGSGGGGTGGGGGGWIQVLQYGQGEWLIPLHELRVVAAGDTWCEVDSWHDPEGGEYLVTTVDGLPFVNPDPIRCGFGTVNSALILWVPAP